MGRGELPLVNLDDRTWQDLVDQAKALIPTYTPEWTDKGPADLGITLIELFAWLVEGMQYRLNQVPDRTYAALLNLMGILREPPHPASTMLTFALVPGQPPTTVDRYFPVGTLQTEQQTAVIFETDDALEVLPSNLRWALQLGPDVDANHNPIDADVTGNLVLSPLSGWTQKLAKGQSVSLFLGFDTAPPKDFALQVRPSTLQYHVPTTTLAMPLDALADKVMVTSAAGFPTDTPFTPFTIQIDDEQLSVTSIQTQLSTTLQADIDGTVTTLTVASAANFPNTPFTIWIDSEQLSVTNKHGTNNTAWTVTRGQGGTQAMPHPKNSAVNLPLMWTVQRHHNGTTAAPHGLNVAVTMPSVSLAWSYPTGPLTQLAADIDGAVTTLTVASADGFPTTGPFTIQIEKELLTVTGGQGTANWTVSRGANGTTGEKHLKNTAVMLALMVVDPGKIRDSSNGLRRTGSVTLPKLDNWAARLGSIMAPNLPTDSALAPVSAYWLQLKITANAWFNVVMALDFILANSVSASHVRTVVSEQVANITPGAPDPAAASDQPWQRFELKYGPVFAQPNSPTPYADVQLVVGERQPDGTVTGDTWDAVDDFPPGPKACYRLDPVAGTLLFGDYDAKIRPRGYGMIPPAGSKVFASYRAVAGGAVGDVPYGTLVIPQRRLGNDPGGTSPLLSVTNPGPGVGGADEEAPDDAKRRAPDVLRVRNRAVTAEDYASLALEASKLVKKSAALATPTDWPFWDGVGGLQRRPGLVNVLIVPDASTGDPQPTASASLIDEVRAYLDDRRVVSTALAVGPPRYAPVAVNLVVKLFPGPGKDDNLKTKMTNDLTGAIKKFLHPLTGGPGKLGWDIGQTLFVSGLFGVIEPILGALGFVEQLTVALNPDRPDGGSLIKGQPNPAVRLPVLDFELICSAADAAHHVDVQYLPPS